MLPLLYSILALVSFDGLSVACSCFLSLDVKMISWVMLCKALETNDYMTNDTCEITITKS